MVKGPSDIYKIVRMIMERNYQPVIIFAFSKRECESLGLQMSKLDFNDGWCFFFISLFSLPLSLCCFLARHICALHSRIFLLLGNRAGEGHGRQGLQKRD